MPGQPGMLSAVMAKLSTGDSSRGSVTHPGPPLHVTGHEIGKCRQLCAGLGATCQ